jgi:hypothetical protein
VAAVLSLSTRSLSLADLLTGTDGPRVSHHRRRGYLRKSGRYVLAARPARVCRPGRRGVRRPADPAAMCYGLTAKLRVVQPALEALPPEAASIELPHTWPVVAVVGEAGSGLAPA